VIGVRPDMLTFDPSLKEDPLACPGNRGSSYRADSYHVISRGNDRKEIFRSPDDYVRFTEIVASQRPKLPLYLYAYCLRPEDRGVA
jgi:hypothetical protein